MGEHFYFKYLMVITHILAALLIHSSAGYNLFETATGVKPVEENDSLSKYREFKHLKREQNLKDYTVCNVLFCENSDCTDCKEEKIEQDKCVEHDDYSLDYQCAAQGLLIDYH